MKEVKAYECKCERIYKEKDYKYSIYSCQDCGTEICVECGFTCNILKCWDCARKDPNIYK